VVREPSVRPLRPPRGRRPPGRAAGGGRLNRKGRLQKADCRLGRGWSRARRAVA